MPFDIFLLLFLSTTSPTNYKRSLLLGGIPFGLKGLILESIFLFQLVGSFDAHDFFMTCLVLTRFLRQFIHLILFLVVYTFKPYGNPLVLPSLLVFMLSTRNTDYFTSRGPTHLSIYPLHCWHAQNLVYSPCPPVPLPLEIDIFVLIFPVSLNYET